MTGDWLISEEQAGERLDQFLLREVQEERPEITRSHVQKWIKQEWVLLNGQTAKTGAKLKAGDRVELEEEEPDIPMNADPEPMDLDIVYEDEDLAIVNKPSGLVVHPSAGHPSGTLVNGLMYHFQGNLSGINGVLRPGIVHRIDKDTSGLLVICKSDRAHQALSEKLSVHDIVRKYHAIVLGNIKEDAGTVDQPIGRSLSDRKKMAVVRNGRRAVTHYRVLERFGQFTYVELTLETGRTHQIRVHMKSLGHPVLGDPLYGPETLSKEQAKRLGPLKEEVLAGGQMLHAKVLGFDHPITGQPLYFDSPLPEVFDSVLTVLRETSFL